MSAIRSSHGNVTGLGSAIGSGVAGTSSFGRETPAASSAVVSSSARRSISPENGRAHPSAGAVACSAVRRVHRRGRGATALTDPPLIRLHAVDDELAFRPAHRAAVGGRGPTRGGGVRGAVRPDGHPPGCTRERCGTGRPHRCQRTGLRRAGAWSSRSASRVRHPPAWRGSAIAVPSPPPHTGPPTLLMSSLGVQYQGCGCCPRAWHTWPGPPWSSRTGACVRPRPPHLPQVLFNLLRRVALPITLPGLLSAATVSMEQTPKGTSGSPGVP